MEKSLFYLRKTWYAIFNIKKELKSMDMTDSNEIILKRLNEEINELDKKWFKFDDIKQLIDKMFEYNRYGWLDDRSLIKESSSWQTHREGFDKDLKNKSFKPSDGNKKEEGDNKGRQYHVEYVKAVIKFRFKQLKEHYEKNTVVIENFMTGKMERISIRENELREQLGGRYEEVKEELFTEVAIKFAQKHMDLIVLNEDLNKIIINGKDEANKKVLKRFNEADYHK